MVAVRERFIPGLEWSTKDPPPSRHNHNVTDPLQAALHPDRPQTPWTIFVRAIATPQQDTGEPTWQGATIFELALVLEETPRQTGERIGRFGAVFEVDDQAIVRPTSTQNLQQT